MFKTYEEMYEKLKGIGRELDDLLDELDAKLYAAASNEELDLYDMADDAEKRKILTHGRRAYEYLTVLRADVKRLANEE